ncbi:unnamed protein product [Penicillium glandicola]
MATRIATCMPTPPQASKPCRLMGLADDPICLPKIYGSAYSYLETVKRQWLEHSPHITEADGAIKDRPRSVQVHTLPPSNEGSEKRQVNNRENNLMGRRTYNHAAEAFARLS